MKQWVIVEQNEDDPQVVCTWGPYTDKETAESVTASLMTAAYVVYKQGGIARHFSVAELKARPK